MPKRWGTKSDTAELLTGHFYHVYNRIIGGEAVFTEYSHGHTYARHFIHLIKHCLNFSSSFSIHRRVETNLPKLFRLEEPPSNPGGLYLSLRKFIPVHVHAYTIMPNHFHIVLEQILDNGISYYVGRILNSFTKVYNKENSRIGPLWQSRFKSKLIDSSESYLQVMRYVHLNPVKNSRLNIHTPRDYPFSSYLESTGYASKDSICKHEFLYTIVGGPQKYEQFVSAPITIGERTLSQSLSLEKDTLGEDT